MTSNTTLFLNKYTSFELIYLHASATANHLFVVGWNSIRLVSYKTQEPMNRSNRQLPSYST